LDSIEPGEIPVVVLCGGRDVDLGAKRCLKALAPLCGAPLVVWLLRHYLRHGFRKFYLAAGRRADALDAAVRAMRAEASVEVIPTGPDSSTGARLLTVAARLPPSHHVALTYSDTLSDIDLSKLLSFHLERAAEATLLATRMPTRFLVLGLKDEDDVVRGVAPRPVVPSAFINGGYYLFRRPCLERWLGEYAPESQPVLENELVADLIRRGGIQAFRHGGAWQHLDGPRDLPALERIVTNGL
jgi:glucose-1-phosphate cytidylyltransferase